MKTKTNNELGCSLTILEINGKPAMVAKEVGDILGYANTPQAIQKSNLEKGLDYDVIEGDELNKFANLSEIFTNMTRSLTVLYESGFYGLVMKSQKPNALKFRNWVTREVLPSIRKNGMYATDVTIKKMIDDPDFAIQLLTTLKKERDERIIAENKVKKLIPAKQFTDNFFLDPEQNLFSLQEVSNILGKGFGRTTLIKMLRQRNVLQQNNLRPLQQYIDREWFKVKITTHPKNPKYPQTFITRKGFGHICKLLGVLEQPTQLNLFQNN